MLLKKSKLFNAFVCIITALSVFSLVFPYNVRAENNDKSVTLVCVSGNTVLSGMTWKLYKVGERTSNNMNFVQTGDFSAIQVNLQRLTPERVNEAAQTFQSYAIANGLQPLREGQTDSNGEVEFNGLDAGLYLLSGKLLKIGTNYYVPTTALIEIREDDSDLRYDAYPKFEYQVANQTPRHYFAYKKWVGDEENPDKRPKQVIFDIYRDEEYYDSVVLSDENNWKCDWIDYEGVSQWMVMEKDVPEHYELQIIYDESRFTLYNSYTEENIGTTTTVQSGQTTTTTTTFSGPTGDGSATTTVSTDVSGETVTRTDTATTTTLQSGSSQTGTDTSTSTTSGSTSTSGKNGGSGNSGGNSSGGGKGNGSSSGGKSNSSSSSSRKLPQTGQLWWPVVPLSIGGVLLVGAGLVIRARRKED